MSVEQKEYTDPFRGAEDDKANNLRQYSHLRGY